MDSLKERLKQFFDFEIEQEFFGLQSGPTRKTRQLTIGAGYAMTRDNDGDGVTTTGPANGSRRRI